MLMTPRHKQRHSRDFAVEQMEPLDHSLRDSLGIPANKHVTTKDAVRRSFALSQCDVIACSHTCLPFAQRFDTSEVKRTATLPRSDPTGLMIGEDDGGSNVLINNGAAGMPNFAGVPSAGVITRVSITPDTPVDSLYGTTCRGVRIDALSLNYGSNWVNDSFLVNHPPGSPAHTSYISRITSGPDFFTTRQAARSGVALMS